MSIDKWKELNKGWLCEMHRAEETLQSFQTWALCEIVDGEHPGTSSLWYYSWNEVICMDIGMDDENNFNYNLISGEAGCFQFETPFRDWKCPTQQEKDMYEMLTGVKIVWSEEFPFKTLEDE